MLIHDGVRPFVTRPLIDRVLGGLEGAHGSIPALAVTDTLKEAHGEFVVRTVPRAGLYHVQTPQAFPTDLVRDAHTRAARDGLDVTDDSAL
ncbi:MAG TPA: 2-C-methyl-D-erythritol 4-phosphate cytidylyltransferase, partial [Deltaproteobacteria bacterium]|nr:2-C-methyl-D-erythritol 4-phosphate cytidylyltransferase [Deltaproteobacteria bacterium]